MYSAGLPHAYCIQGSYKWCNCKLAAAQKCLQQSLSIEEKLGALHELGTTYLEMGNRTSDSLFLKRAEIIFDKIDAKT